MNRTLVYPGEIPQDTDILYPQRSMMKAMGYLSQALFGTSMVIEGLACVPSVGLQVIIQPGQMYDMLQTDEFAYGTLSYDSHSILKQGVIEDSLSLDVIAPLATGKSINHLIMARLVDQDGSPVVLPYYNASDPASGWHGVNNDGQAQNTTRSTVIDIQLRSGAEANSGTQITPSVEAGFTGLYVITVAYGQTTISQGNIVAYSNINRSVGNAILQKLLSVDGPSSGLDADTVDGVHATNLGFPVGSVISVAKTTPPVGWLACNGGSIGDSLSGATLRANDDTLDLFTIGWNDWTGVGIYTSTGSVSTKGASASADFAAHKRLQVFDLRDDFIRGTNVSRPVGTRETDTFKAHIHSVSSYAGVEGGQLMPSGPAYVGGGVQTGSTGGTETRPRNVALLYCIKY